MPATVAANGERRKPIILLAYKDAKQDDLVEVFAGCGFEVVAVDTALAALNSMALCQFDAALISATLASGCVDSDNSTWGQKATRNDTLTGVILVAQMASLSFKPQVWLQIEPPGPDCLDNLLELPWIKEISQSGFPCQNLARRISQRLNQKPARALVP
ncbi:MAG: hypothetical protein WCX71_01470 [Candidatus Buchananbacteria bacterium]